MNTSLKQALVLLVLVTAACERAPEAEPAESAEHAAAPHWSYDGAAGPESWAQLSQQFATCGTGGHQSPIEISAASAVSEPLPPIHFNYTPAHVSLGNNGHTLQAGFENGSFIELDGRRYDLLQLHFHHPSEHVVEGRHAELELHLVHRDTAGQLAVVGVLIDTATAGNAALAAAFSRLPSAEGVASELELDPSALLPGSHSYVTYEGSLTTPPCTEGVRWLVLQAPVTARPEAVAAFARLFPHNARPVQPLGGRVVRVSAPAQ